MAVNVLDAALLSKMFLSGAKNLENKKDYINELNVFPVPDGDTGTNMTLTIMSAANDVSKLENPDMVTLCKTMSSGSLRGARGNSGVILSQLLRGFTKIVKDYDNIDVALISAGFDKAVETAYKAVMKPKEGTILTVAKGMAEKASSLFEDGTEDIQVFLEQVIAYGFEVLDKTPDMLPVLKEAGVVDSGGQGLMEFMQGAYNALMGKAIEFTIDEDMAKVASETRMIPSDEGTPKKVVYLYDTKVKIYATGQSFNAKSANELLEYLNHIGEDAEVNVNEDDISVSVMTNDPGLVLQKALKIGALEDVKVINLHDIRKSSSDASKAEKPVKDEPRKPVGFISVSCGDGFGEIFKNLGVDYLIEGGQTMNPSTEDMLNAIDKINADTIFILPNNKNIVMAANQARDMTEDKKIIVIPTKTVPQGISAVIAYVAEVSDEENEKTMLESIKSVKTGQVTYAVRDTTIDGHEIHQGDYMGIGDEGILSNGDDIVNITVEMIEKMADSSAEIISIYTGSEAKEEDTDKIQKALGEKFPKCDIDLQKGNQPVYYYIISVE